MNMPFKNLLTPVLNQLRHLLPDIVGNNFGIGLDLGLDKLNLVQMRPGVQHLYFSAIASWPYPCPHEVYYSSPKNSKPPAAGLIPTATITPQQSVLPPLPTPAAFWSLGMHTIGTGVRG